MCAIAYRFVVGLLSVSSFSAALFAQGGPETLLWKSPLIIAAAGDKFRFSSPAPTAQIRVQIFSANDMVFDSGWRDGNVLDVDDSLANGSYRCTVMIKDIDGQLTRKDATLTVEDGRRFIDGQASDNDALSPKLTLMAHDGSNGSVISTSGDLSFRFGNFLRGNDNERMRLTAAGNLGIGTDNPQAPLDVNGVIRTSKGILFPDGTMLTTAAGLTGIEESGGVVRQPPSAPDKRRTIIRGRVATTAQPPSVSADRLKPRPTALDYQFKVDDLGVHIGTTTAFGLDVMGNATLSSNLLLPATSSASAGVVSLGGLPFIHHFNGNTFVGRNAGNFTTTGDTVTAIGDGALAKNANGAESTACGAFALRQNTDGFQNTAAGAFALESVTIGSGNIGVGIDAGGHLTSGDNNIDIGNLGVAAEANTIRIGTAGTQTRAFLAGVRGATTLGDGLTVLIDSAGQLGTVLSTASVKREIAAIGEDSAAILKLRPVSFFYRNDAAGIRQYGLIAEEVAEVMPGLVQLSSSGEPETVRYHFLAPLMLNEIQKQHRTIDEQRALIDDQQQQNAALRRRLERLEKIVDELKREK